MTREVKFLSNDYTNYNTNPKTLTTLTLTLTDPKGAFESFCVPVFCDFVRNYSCTVDGAIDTSIRETACRESSCVDPVEVARDELVGRWRRSIDEDCSKRLNYVHVDRWRRSLRFNLWPLSPLSGGFSRACVKCSCQLLQSTVHRPVDREMRYMYIIDYIILPHHTLCNLFLLVRLRIWAIGSVP